MIVYETPIMTQMDPVFVGMDGSEMTVKKFGKVAMQHAKFAWIRIKMSVLLVKLAFYYSTGTVSNHMNAANSGEKI